VSVSARAWCRVDLGGGTLDIWPLGLLHRGARTVNLAIDLAVTVTLSASADGRFRVRQDGSLQEAKTAAELAMTPGAELLGLVAGELALPPVEIMVHSESPRGAGLGASSALTMAAIAAAEAWHGSGPSTVEQRAVLARDLEACLMGLPTGRQDHYAAALGGVLEILHRPGGGRVRRLRVDLEELAAALLVAHSGRSHFSGATNWQIIRGRLEGDRATVDRFGRIAEVTASLPAALEGGDLESAGRLMRTEWQQRRGLAAGVSTARIEKMLAAAEAAGAWGGKVCGAGGGGCVAVLAPPARRQEVARALADSGGRLLPAAPTGEPLSVESAPAEA
jgi:D-glycero-alpha-D-manno-heptose-7-phosphate kinase